MFLHARSDTVVVCLILFALSAAHKIDIPLTQSTILSSKILFLFGFGFGSHAIANVEVVVRHLKNVRLHKNE